MSTCICPGCKKPRKRFVSKKVSLFCEVHQGRRQKCCLEYCSNICSDDHNRKSTRTHDSACCEKHYDKWLFREKVQAEKTAELKAEQAARDAKLTVGELEHKALLEEKFAHDRRIYELEHAKKYERQRRITEQTCAVQEQLRAEERLRAARK